MTEIWFRNAQSCLLTCAEEGVTRLTWTRQHLSRLGHDGLLLTRQFYLHTPLRPKIMLIGVQGSAEYNIFSKFNEPEAVYPSWSGKEDSLDDLLDFIERPWGENRDRCTDLHVPDSLRPVWGQRHRVVIHNPPITSSGVGKRFWIDLASIQEDHPEVDLFINGTGSFAVMFGLKFKACDYGLSDKTDVNQVIRLPNGMNLDLTNPNSVEKLYQWQDWITLLGFSINELLANKSQARYRFRIRSLRWAAAHWSENYRFHRDTYNLAIDSESSDDQFSPTTGRYVLSRRRFTLRDADRFLCNRCRIAPGCKFYRQDSVCGLGDSEVTDLTRFFQSRDAGRIVDGLAEIVKLQAGRVQRALEDEEATGELDPETNKAMNNLFSNGVKLAQLVDPNLKGGPKVQVNVGVNNGNAEIVSMANPREVIAGISRELEARGIPREAQTPSMIEGVLKGMSAGNGQQQATQAQAAISAEPISATEIIARENQVTKVPVEF